MAKLTADDFNAIAGREHDSYIKQAKNAGTLDFARLYERRARTAAEKGGFDPSELTADDINAIARIEHDNCIEQVKNTGSF